MNEAGVGDQGDPDALTVSEFAALFGMTQQSARRRLAILVSRGAALETRKKRPGLSVAKAYRLITLPAKKGHKH